VKNFTDYFFVCFFFLSSIYVVVENEPVALQQYMSEHDLENVALIFIFGNPQRLFPFKRKIQFSFFFRGGKKGIR
jgi:hypothetical protein